MLGLLPAAPAPARAEPTCESDPLILACFDAYETGLRSFHGRQLDAIADRIAASREWKFPIDLVTVIGHAAKYKQTDPVVKNSRERAETVAQALATRLQARGLPGVRIEQGFLGIDAPRTTNATQAGRALNRRAEVFLDNRGYLGRRERALGASCGKSARTEVIRGQAIPCLDDREAEAVCRQQAEISPGRLAGAACSPLEIRCVVCGALGG